MGRPGILMLKFEVFWSESLCVFGVCARRIAVRFAWTRRTWRNFGQRCDQYSLSLAGKSCPSKRYLLHIVRLVTSTDGGVLCPLLLSIHKASVAVAIMRFTVMTQSVVPIPLDQGSRNLPLDVFLRVKPLLRAKRKPYPTKFSIAPSSPDKYPAQGEISTFRHSGQEVF